MRILALDVGDVRIGLAISDPMQILANPLETYRRTGKIEQDAAYVANLVKEREVGRIVCGWPNSMNNTENEQTRKTKEFADVLAIKTDVPMVFMDERLTTVSATRVLIDGGVRREDRKKVVDKIAATIILEDYLRTL